MFPAIARNITRPANAFITVQCVAYSLQTQLLDHTDPAI